VTEGINKRGDESASAATIETEGGKDGRCKRNRRGRGR
jgi:hypothetical protein